MTTLEAIALYAVLALVVLVVLAILVAASYSAGYRKAHARRATEIRIIDEQCGQLRAQVDELIVGLKSANLRVMALREFIGKVAEERRASGRHDWQQAVVLLMDQPGPKVGRDGMFHVN